jgi:hypothetical protein
MPLDIDKLRVQFDAWLDSVTFDEMNDWLSKHRQNMSTKLNAEELAAKRYKDEHEPDAVINVSPYQWVRLGYSTAIREVAQPIADERDEALVVLRDIVDFCDDPDGSTKRETLAEGLSRMLPSARAILAKYPKP